MKKILSSPAFRITVSLIAIGFVIYFLHDKLGEAVHIVLEEVNWVWFGAAFAAYAIVQVIMAARLWRIFLIQGVGVSYLKTLSLCVVGLFFNLFLPSAVGGDVAKIYYAYKYSGKKIASTTSVILDRLLGLIAIMLIAMTAMFFYHKEFEDPRVSFIFYFFLFLIGSVTVFFASRRFARQFKWVGALVPSQAIREKFLELYHALYACKNHVPTLVSALALSIAGQCLVIISTYWLGISLGAEVPAGVYFVIIPLVSILSMAPSLGGLGVREAGSVYFFSHYMDTERALALSLLTDFLIYGIGFLSGLWYAFAGGLKSKSFQPAEALKEGE
ncbi:MAG: flippase-like domain-containing protein [Candidatus Omnitrophica bacterium]|nr:flippase-like domain-containing protein [Candidatus Omnitrophota bacterium]